MCQNYLIFAQQTFLQENLKCFSSIKLPGCCTGSPTFWRFLFEPISNAPQCEWPWPIYMKGPLRSSITGFRDQGLRPKGLCVGTPRMVRCQDHGFPTDLFFCSNSDPTIYDLGQVTSPHCVLGTLFGKWG